VPAASTARRDVDVADDLAEVQRLGVGPATRAVLGLDRDPVG
jgi:2-phospho-L-lactate guanylyltransferase